MVTWTDQAADYLLNTTACPRCGSRGLQEGRCPRCGADLRGTAGQELWDASNRAAEALRARQAIIDALPTGEKVPAAAVTVPQPSASPAPAGAAGTATAPRSSFSVQSVLAVAGAGLFAVAAIVFTFLNPDLTDFATRTTIIAVVTVLFLAGAALLARRGLQFSAEAIGGLGMVFVALDIWAFSEAAPESTSGWYFAALGLLVASAAVVAIGAVTRVRSWLWGGLIGLALTPAFVGYAIDGPWAALLGHLAVGAAALALHTVARGREARFGNPLKAEHRALTMLQLISTAAVLAHLLVIASPDDVTRAFRSAGVLAALALLASLGTRVGIPRVWSYLAGALATSAVAVLPLALRIDMDWMPALLPLAAAVALALLCVTPAWASVPRSLLVGGGWTVLLMVTLPAAAISLEQVLTTSGWRTDHVLGLAGPLGLAATAVGSVALARLARRFPTGVGISLALPVALWLAVGALVTFSRWTGLALGAQVAVGIAIAIGLALALARVRRIAAWPMSRRLPLLLGVHVAILLAALASWTDDAVTVVAGIAVVLAIGVAAFVFPARWRLFHVGAGYAYALLTFATALDLAGVETIAVPCLTTTLGSLGAITATLMPRIAARDWYAVLVVTAVPFLIGVASVLGERSGWTALSTGVTFALALTLVLTRRPGLNLAVRTAAAALLVPALAVVVVCLGAQVLAVSASPITLPVIAAIVAVTLPSTGLIGRALERRGIPQPAARAARVTIEATSLLTAAIAVLLALVRVAAGLETTLLVFVILGFGATAAGILTRRTYAWAVAGTSWTGALWSFWALIGIQVLEPYVLPPALAAAIVGTILVWRGASGVRLYTAGLVVAVLSSLLALALIGGSDGPGPWRAIGLLGGSGVLVLIGAVTSRLAATSRFAGLRRLSVPSTLVAAGAALAGVIQGVRLGWSLDPDGMATAPLVMLPVLALALIAAGLATLAGRLLSGRTSTRWLYAPTLVYLVAGPIAAVRPGWLPILVTLGLALALLGIMIATVVRARRGPTHLPPVWFTFALAWVTAVASWSERDLRVEAYSLPLGLALIAAGVIASRPAPDARAAALTSWPVGFSGSWRLLAPGLLVTLVPSMLATGTDPRTERAILVIGLALAAILIGSLRKLAAPFILGIIVLPIENLIVFFVRLGRSIEAAPWWITLATAGAVLLVIAVSYERRSASERGIAARLRDLT